MTLFRRLRKLLNPPRRYYRCGPTWEMYGPYPGETLRGCGKIVTRRWFKQEDLHMPGGLFDFEVCGEWRVISAASASAQRHRMGA